MNKLKNVNVPSTFTLKILYGKEILDGIKNLKNVKAQPVDDITTKTLKDNKEIFQTYVLNISVAPCLLVISQTT